MISVDLKTGLGEAEDVLNLFEEDQMQLSLV